LLALARHVCASEFAFGGVFATKERRRQRHFQKVERMATCRKFATLTKNRPSHRTKAINNNNNLLVLLFSPLV